MRGAFVIASLCACVPAEDYAAFQCPAASTDVPAQITLTGMVSDVLTYGEGLKGITVTPTTPGTMATTDAGGLFSVTLMTNSEPLKTTLELTGSGFFPAAFVPAADLTGDRYVLAEVASFADLAAFGSSAGSDLQIGSDEPLLFVSAVDCMDNALYGASITVSDGTVLFIGSDAPDETLTETHEPYGAAIVLGISGSSVEVAGTLGTQPLQGHPVAVAPGVLTETELPPQ